MGRQAPQIVRGATGNDLRGKDFLVFFELVKPKSCRGIAADERCV